jgi:hypothetical protein
VGTTVRGLFCRQLLLCLAQRKACAYVCMVQNALHHVSVDGHRCGIGVSLHCHAADRRRRRRREREAELVYAKQLEDLPLEDIAKEMQDSWQLKVAPPCSAGVRHVLSVASASGQQPSGGHTAVMQQRAQLLAHGVCC